MDENQNEETPLLRNNSENGEQEDEQDTISGKKKVFAGCCALAASATFCINNLIIQEKNLHCTDLLLMRSLLQLIIFASWLKIRGIQWWPRSQTYSTRREHVLDVIYAIIQVISSETVLTMTWLSLSLLPIGNAMAFIYTSPISVIILSYFILKHRIGLYRSFIAVVTIIGAVLVTIFSQDSSLSSMSGPGILVAFTVAFFPCHLNGAGSQHPSAQDLENSLQQPPLCVVPSTPFQHASNYGATVAHDPTSPFPPALAHASMSELSSEIEK